MLLGIVALKVLLPKPAPLTADVATVGNAMFCPQ
jgi:hypothetical protein